MPTKPKTFSPQSYVSRPPPPPPEIVKNVMVIEITGQVCAGKTWVIDRLRGLIDLEVWAWDVKEDFYVPFGILTDDGLDLDKFRRHRYQLPIELGCKVNEAKAKASPSNKIIFFIEHSGVGEWMRDAISYVGSDHVINIETPRDVIKLRIAENRSRQEQIPMDVRGITQGEAIERIQVLVRGG